MCVGCDGEPVDRRSFLAGVASATAGMAVGCQGERPQPDAREAGNPDGKPAAQKPPHTLSALAAAADCHPSHLARAFRRCYGCSVGDYLRGLRLDAAARELSHTRKALAEVAAGAGFYDQSHFTRAFKARFRMTPGAFRDVARPG